MPRWENSATSCLGPSAPSPVLAAPHVPRQGQQRPPQCTLRSCPSFATRQTPVGLLASEMAYFSTVFKTEVTVSAQVREADKDQCFLIWCSAQSDAQHVCMGGWKSCRTLGPRCPQSRASRLLVPALGADAGMAVPQGLKLGSHGVGLLGGGWYRRGGWIAVRPYLCCRLGHRPHLRTT